MRWGLHRVWIGYAWGTHWGTDQLITPFLSKSLREILAQNPVLLCLQATASTLLLVFKLVKCNACSALASNPPRPPKRQLQTSHILSPSEIICRGLFSAVFIGSEGKHTFRILGSKGRVIITCVYIYIYIYIYICIHTHITCMYIYIYIHIYLYLYLSLSLYIYVYIYIVIYAMLCYVIV